MAITTNTTPNEWSGVFNEILVEFQREDFAVTSITGTALVLTAGSSVLKVGDYVYIYGDTGGGKTSGEARNRDCLGH